MRAIIDGGRPAILTMERDDFGEEYERITVISIDDAERLRRELWQVVSELEPGRARQAYLRSKAGQP